MLRHLYCAVLRAHPRYFRERFAEEMQGIFDQVEGPLGRAGLLADAVLSMLRQWTLRPEFWEEPAVGVTANGTPLFYSLGPSVPRGVALAYGAFMSALVLQGVCWTMGYAWNHPRYMNIRPGYGPKGRVPEKFLHERPVYHAPSSAEPALTTDQGRVLLVFNLHKGTAPAQSSGEERKQSTPPPSVAIPAVSASSTTSTVGLSIVSDELQSYTGSYVSAAPSARVNVTMDSGRLQLEVVGEFRSELLLLEEPQRMGCHMADCWVAFSADASGTVDGIDVHYRGRDIRAVREQRGMVF